VGDVEKPGQSSTQRGRAAHATGPDHTQLTPIDADARFDAQAAIDALGDAIIVIGADWRVRYVNGPWERILDVPRATAIGADFWSTYPGLCDDPGASMIRATSADGATRRFDLEHWLAGELRSYGVRVARDADGCIVLSVARSFQMVKSTRDRTLEDRNEENAALRALARQTAEVADMPTLLSLLCMTASAQCGGQGATLISMHENEGELTSAVGIIAPAQGRRFSLEGSLARDVVRLREVGLLEDFEKSSRPLAAQLTDISIGPVIVAPLIAHERELGVLMVVRDRHSVAFSTRDAQRLIAVADYASLAVWKSQLLEQAQEADRAKGRFLATMSHELRTPLTALAGYEELLVDAVLGPLSDAQREVLERMHYVTQHLSAMIEDVLAFTNLETGGEVVRPTDFLAADLLTAVAAVVQPLADQKKIALVTESASTPIRMTTDIDKARQVLVNLAGNAVKFTARGEVRLALELDGHDVRFEVRDTGIGIAPTDLQRLFRPFTQLDSGLTRRHGGTGLGLYIAHRFATLLRGGIQVESELGRGTTFTLVLPRE
jgi:signal transduction histidine kinase